MNLLAIKQGSDGADIGARHFDPPMVPIWVAILELSPKTTDGHVWVTSGSDSHQVLLHPNFRALDVRTHNIKRPNDVERFADRLRRRLGRHYDVKVEGDHIHIEYDPKGEA